MLRTTLTPLLAAALFAASGAVFAQTSQGGDAKPPAAKQERRAKMRAAHEKAEKACQGKQGAEHTACMRTQFCASAKDPAACETRAKEAQARRDQAREACKDKKGDDYNACMRDQRRAAKK